MQIFKLMSLLLLIALSNPASAADPIPSPLPKTPPCDPGDPDWPHCLPTQAEIQAAFSHAQPSNVYFWTQQGIGRALRLADETAGTTLEGSLDSANLRMPTNNVTRCLAEMDEVHHDEESANNVERAQLRWAWASEALAQQTRGVVYLATDVAPVNPNSYWLRCELPALRLNPAVPGVVQYAVGEEPRVVENFNRGMTDAELLETRDRILAANAAQTFSQQFNSTGDIAWPQADRPTRYVLIMNPNMPSNIIKRFESMRRPTPAQMVRSNFVLYGGMIVSFAEHEKVVLYSLVPMPASEKLSDSDRIALLLSKPVIAAHFTNGDIDPYRLEVYENYNMRSKLEDFDMQDLGLFHRLKNTIQYHADIDIVSVGSSMTSGVGSSDGSGYRKLLKRSLSSEGHKITFKGSQNDPTDSELDYEGVANASIRDVLDIAKRAVGNSPDFVLLEAGTSDLQNAGVDIEAAARDFAGLLDEVIDRYPGSVVLVAALVSAEDDAMDDRVVSFNQKLKALIQTRIIAGKNTNFVPMNDLEPSDFADGIHLNDLGYAKLASHWANVIRSYLGRIPKPVILGEPCAAVYKNDGGTGPVASRGAKMPWEEIQAEDGETNALKLGPCRTKWNASHIEAEAIGRKAVALQKEGDFIKFKPKNPFNTLVIRYSVPDTVGGGGADYKLGLYIDGVFVQDVVLTSKYSWNYGGERLGNPDTDIPGSLPHTFFDEANLIFPAFKEKLLKGDGRNSFTNAIGGDPLYYKPGTVVELRRDARHAADFYIIDLVDFEEIAPPEMKAPEGFVSAKELGILPNGKDYARALEQALFINPNPNDDPQKNIRKIWFPPGTYKLQDFNVVQTPSGTTVPAGASDKLTNLGIDCHNCEIRGAGIWYTELAGRRAMFYCLGGTTDPQNPTACKFSNFRMSGEAKFRAEEIDGPNKAFAGPLGSGSTIDNVWIEHYVAGIWIGSDPPYQVKQTTNLKITNCRIRNIYADGINFANGTSLSSVDTCHIRNSGDDAVAIWSVNWADWVKEKRFADPNMTFDPLALGQKGQGVGHGNSVKNISVQMPWRANCFAVYGGHSNTFENSTCEDVLTYPGVLIDNEFSPYDFGLGSDGEPIQGSDTVFRNITIKRAGGQMFNDLTPNPETHGALKFYAREGNVSHVLVENVDIISPTYSGIEFRGFTMESLRTLPNGQKEKMEPDLMKKALSATFSSITLKNVKVTDAGASGVLLEKGVRNGQGGGTSIPSVKLESVRIIPNAIENRSEIQPSEFFGGSFEGE
ncbi:MAG: hypothetical protein EOP04_01360 [Proteobacteria bacterium]|nr:MAG: hypothetical protein EOP04_01360 [Pseudomonadota bacterium]